MMPVGDAHAKHAASLLDHMDEALARAQALGFQSASTAELSAAIDDVRKHLGLQRAQPPPGVVRGLLAEMFVLTHELRPQAMKSYGALSPELTSYLEAEAARLMDLAGKVLDDVEVEPNKEVT